MLHVRGTPAPSPSLRLTRTERSEWQLATGTHTHLSKSFAENIHEIHNSDSPKKLSATLCRRTDQYGKDQTKPESHHTSVRHWFFRRCCWKLLEQEALATAWTGTTAFTVGIFCNYNRIIRNNKGSV